ncbi:MAG: hypothetical protein PVJ57_15885 [Phycisphaerae bacterium]
MKVCRRLWKSATRSASSRYSMPAAAKSALNIFAAWWRLGVSANT